VAKSMARGVAKFRGLKISANYKAQHSCSKR